MNQDNYFAHRKWELVLCRICGSQGTHLSCGRLKWADPVWECQDCIAIISEFIVFFGLNEDFFSHFLH